MTIAIADLKTTLANLDAEIAALPPGAIEARRALVAERTRVTRIQTFTKLAAARATISHLLAA